jgi:hypothetical protein
MPQVPTKVKIKTIRRRTKPKRRVVVTKNKTYHLPADRRGMPIEECYPGIKLPKSLQGAKIYLTDDGPVAVVPQRNR